MDAPPPGQTAEIAFIGCRNMSILGRILPLDGEDASALEMIERERLKWHFPLCLFSRLTQGLPRPAIRCTLVTSMLRILQCTGRMELGLHLLWTVFLT